MNTLTFTAWPKIARLNRRIVITEKIDGTNAAVGVLDAAAQAELGIWTPGVDDAPEPLVYAQSRTRIITPDDDNFGFAKWVADHAPALAAALGPGLHFGEWWGSGIQRGYGLVNGDKRFSLFNTERWAQPEARESLLGLDGDAVRPVPVLYEGPYSPQHIEAAVEHLRELGSKAAPGFMQPEGIVVYHTAARTMFKVTLEKDEEHKGAHV